MPYIPLPGRAALNPRQLAMLAMQRRRAAPMMPGAPAPAPIGGAPPPLGMMGRRPNPMAMRMAAMSPRGGMPMPTRMPMRGMQYGGSPEPGETVMVGENGPEYVTAGAGGAQVRPLNTKQGLQNAQRGLGMMRRKPPMIAPISDNTPPYNYRLPDQSLFATPGIRGYQSGGTMQPGETGLVGEAGPEAVS